MGKTNLFLNNESFPMSSLYFLAGLASDPASSNDTIIIQSNADIYSFPATTV